VVQGGVSRDPRPRDAMGRPLARDSGVAIEPDPEPLPPDESLAAAQALLDDGRAFRAHEVLEAIWKNDATQTRELWRGLAQLAVGLTHAQRGNARGAVALLRRARATLASYDGARPHGVDVNGLRQWAENAAAVIDQSGDPASIGAAGPMPRLHPASASGS
jgi:hypothetical protein